MKLRCVIECTQIKVYYVIENALNIYKINKLFLVICFVSL